MPRDSVPRRLNSGNLNQLRAREIQRLCRAGEVSAYDVHPLPNNELQHRAADEFAVEHGAKRGTADRLPFPGLYSDVAQPPAGIGDPKGEGERPSG